ncbi:Npun_F5749 family FMN-dependent PPOX-type flavoprotein [Calothrix sp. NIES-3974]|uniref:Npun_F5749 family FMN-dependent PPOX-type flavoprotein n=1 Tax=Calothrix sp. NIES-3974 TaxID=2005462 RepID=UPI000B6030EA|nr:Npun_F5749 family FMN-dependent PPOX-type flavoprotein [Calothrix sp. NIES-3974]BAZ06422.1 pyridoxamine 5'-phosphate oxidase-related FMN-binding protein [Calothrix sp. NIES-3974]
MVSLAPWRSSLSHALHRNRKPFARYFQLATIGMDGIPANRTVVFRGFVDGTNQIKIITDSRSQKYDQIRTRSHGEICWYFTDTREQFRIAGKLILVDKDTPTDDDFKLLRDRTWQDLSESARLQFIWPNPGKKRNPNDDFTVDPPNPNQPVDNFCLLILNPLKVDHLQLRGNPQNRYLYECDEFNNWSVVEVNP